ncbi:FAD/NAD(P)-binding domain-containing protein [Pleomassaria siparia CBS 279.74]|uniref:FAD/NAD(P)-binding domain-containing protein n=1 Tax=Pleomassaria siparia CBS 279.74 TaxID=1314801 RepID=A0A6G1KRM3_9PLEO|nr:FAD/NAD(P)-binding domain-containing protein [Pleomassaria siparia CBS 279.74]
MTELSVSSSTRLNVLIVGGGLCGLATAISVTLAEHKATVFEAASRSHPFGSGIQSSPNGTRILSRWGMNEILEPVITVPETFQLHSLNGELVSLRENFAQEVVKKYKSPFWTVHRVDLQTGLLRRARDLGVDIHYSSRVSKVGNEGTTIQLTNGDTCRGDLVVIADGTWSALRLELFGMTANPQPTEYMCYRITVDVARVHDQELLEIVNTPQCRTWIGPGGYVVGYPIRAGRLFCLQVIVKDNSNQGDLSLGAITEELKLRFEKWDRILITMLGAVQRANKWRLVQVPPPPLETSPGEMYVLAGDCYHSLLPFLAQGLNMGLEDAATLGSLLGNVTSTTQLPKAVVMYHKLRTARAMRILEETDAYRENLQLTNGEHEKTSCKAQDLIWSYDAYKEAEVAYLTEL